MELRSLSENCPTAESGDLRGSVDIDRTALKEFRTLLLVVGVLEAVSDTCVLPSDSVGKKEAKSFKNKTTNRRKKKVFGHLHNTYLIYF